MLVRIVVGKEFISIISAYGPQVGLDDQVKREFWDNLGDLIGTIPADEEVFIAGDFNTRRHITIAWFMVVLVRNESRENLLEFALEKKLVITNSIFRKKDEHLITSKSGGHATQIDYCFVRKGDRSSCLDCKMVLVTEMPTQHRLFVLVFRMRRNITKMKIEFKHTIMWGRLKGNMAPTLSRLSRSAS
ncbi:uncharacterized protein LOC130808318 [Amaranthus tricolor]|uniref:uncharacterized protein LOC130808318 n=1 Tax=Amaranthus tricolor TaxID=29722 RepID=UPI00258C26C2|nr:uncharacterized protein LOC130808318 [Amaranthus tricolor]